MTRAEFLDRLDTLTIWKRGEQRAPHKPLLLLFALGRLSRGEARLANYEHEVREPLRGLLRRFGPWRQSYHPEFPFWHLCSDGVWEITNKDRIGRSSLDSDLRKHRSMGGFPLPVWELLVADRQLREEATLLLLARHFPDSFHRDIRDQVGLPDLMAADKPLTHFGRSKKGVLPRDPRFRRAVITAYERRCAICDFDIRLDDDLLAIDAAHIMWHAAGGPDKEPNGLALCAFHHRALDRGAIGLSQHFTAPRFELLISRELSGQSDAFHQLVKTSGRLLRDPQDPALRPDPQFVSWHRKEVFRGKPRTS